VIRPEQVDQDLALLARYFSCIRTYSTTGLEDLPKVADKYGLKVMLGAWVSGDEAATQIEIDKLVAIANTHPSVVTSVIVGNEALLRKDVSPARLVALIEQVKARVAQPVTYADVWEFWQQYPQIAPAVDFITIHLLPYWENDPTGIDQAIDHVAEVHDLFARQYAPKDIFIGETGWPSAGRQRETALPSRVNEAKFMRGFIARAEAGGWHYNLIEAFDQPWKRANEGAVGGYWGLFDANRVDKNSLTGAVSNLPHWQTWLGFSAVIFVAALFLGGQPTTMASMLLRPLFAAIGAVCIGLWWLQGATDNRNLWEWLWTVALSVLNLAVLAQAVAHDTHRLRWLQHYRGELLLLAAFAGAVLMLQLVFDPRYRQLPSFVLLLPALVYLYAPARVAVNEAKLLAALIAIGIPLQLWQETLTNGQALAWALVCGLLVLALWRSLRTSRNPASNSANTANVTV
jgi:exo-beta-1,3-glucanase (GH17 family)